jgi:hypothetical protein
MAEVAVAAELAEEGSEGRNVGPPWRGSLPELPRLNFKGRDYGQTVAPLVPLTQVTMTRWDWI